MGEPEILAMLECVIKEAQRELLSGYADHDNYVSEAALDALRRAINTRRVATALPNPQTSASGEGGEG